jgi:hypothetical protein
MSFLLVAIRSFLTLCRATANGLVRALYVARQLSPARALGGLRTAKSSLLLSAGVALFGALTTIGFTGIFLIASALSNPWFRESLEDAHRRSSAVEFVDNKGVWLGILPPANFSDWRDGKTSLPDHAAVPLTDDLPTWRACLSHLEDRSAFDGVSRRIGIDPVALAASGFWTLAGQTTRGASTLYMQVVRTLEGRSPDDSAPLGETLLRKASEVFGARALTAMFDATDPRAAERFIGSHLPLIIGAAGSRFGQPVHGVVLASHILFGKPPTALSIEEQAILAAAVKAPILLAPPGDEAGRKQAARRWERVRARADFCLRSAFADDDTVRSARTRLARLRLPDVLEDPVRALLAKDDAAAWAILVNPVRRGQALASSAIAQAECELRSAYPGRIRGHVISIELSINVAENLAFEAAIRATLGQVGQNPDWTVDLSGSAPSRARARVVVAVSDDYGLLTLFYASHPGDYTRLRAEMGSTAKMFAAIALARRDRPSTLYCRLPFRTPRASLKRESICAGAMMIKAIDAFALSDSDAIHWALMRANHADLEAISDAFNLSRDPLTPLETEFSMGLAGITPAELLRNARAVGALAAGFDLESPIPKIIQGVGLLSDFGDMRAGEPRSNNALAVDKLAALATERSLHFIRTTLSATSQTGGTLGGLVAHNRKLGGRLWAKTGTVSRNGATRALQIAGSFASPDLHGFIVTVAPENEAETLGRKLEAAQITALASVAIAHTLGPGGSPRSAER